MNLKKMSKILVMCHKKKIHMVNSKNMKILKIMNLKKKLNDKAPPVISKCKKYLIVMGNYKCTKIRILSLVKDCRSSLVINLDFDFKRFFLGWKNLYFWHKDDYRICYMNIFDYLKKNMKDSGKEKGKGKGKGKGKRKRKLVKRNFVNKMSL